MRSRDRSRGQVYPVKAPTCPYMGDARSRDWAAVTWPGARSIYGLVKKPGELRRQHRHIWAWAEQHCDVTRLPSIKGPGGVPDMTDHENQFYGVFWKGRTRSTSCFLPDQKILIVAKVIAGQRSAPVCISIVRAIFKRNLPQITIFQTSKSIFSYNFWAIIPKLSGFVLGM